MFGRLKNFLKEFDLFKINFYQLKFKQNMIASWIGGLYSLFLIIFMVSIILYKAIIS